MENKKNIFLRILNFPPLEIIIAIILINVPTFILRNLAELLLSALSIDNQVFIAEVIFCVRMLSVYFIYWLFIKIVEQRKAEEISIDLRMVKEVSLGGLLGFSTLTLVMALMWAGGGFSITGINESATLAQSFLYHTFFAFLQDVIYFALVFRIIERSLGSWIAILAAAFIFGFKHLLFPGYTLWSEIAQTIEAGILFSALFILTRRIWLIFGFHLVWNYLQYGLLLEFGSEGLIPLFKCEFSGSSLITGMPVGPEASIFTFILGTLLGIFCLMKAYKKGCFMEPFWKRNSMKTASGQKEESETQ